MLLTYPASFVLRPFEFFLKAVKVGLRFVQRLLGLLLLQLVFPSRSLYFSHEEGKKRKADFEIEIEKIDKKINKLKILPEIVPNLPLICPNQRQFCLYPRKIDSKLVAFSRILLANSHSRFACFLISPLVCKSRPETSRSACINKRCIKDTLIFLAITQNNPLNWTTFGLNKNVL